MRKAREQYGNKGRDGWSAVGIEEFESFECEDSNNDGCHNDTTTGAPRSIQVNTPAPHLAILTE